MRGTPQCTTSTAIDGGIAIGATVVARQSMSSACPACPNSEASWSISPPGTPVAAVSAADATRAASTRSRPRRRRRRRVSATASAELDDSPEPTGTVVSTSRSAGSTVIPRSVSARTTPATNRPHGGSTVAGSALPSTGTDTRPSSWCEIAVIAPFALGAADP